MKSNVFIQIRWITERSLAESALKRFVTGVSTDVDLQAVTVNEQTISVGSLTYAWRWHQHSKGRSNDKNYYQRLTVSNKLSHRTCTCGLSSASHHLTIGRLHRLRHLRYSKCLSRESWRDRLHARFGYRANDRSSIDSNTNEPLVYLVEETWRRTSRTHIVDYLRSTFRVIVNLIINFVKFTAANGKKQLSIKRLRNILRNYLNVPVSGRHQSH